jgi:hypothetical protein
LPDSDYKLHLLESKKIPGYARGCYSSFDEYANSDTSFKPLLSSIPRKSELALIIEVLCELMRLGRPVGSLLNTAKMRVLGITEDSINLEVLRFAEESRSAKTCPYCAESIESQVKSCRFCASDFNRPPTRDSLVEDEDFVSRVIVSAVVNYKVLDKRVPEGVDSLLQKLGVSDSEFQTKIKQRRHEAQEGLEIDLPRSGWHNRILNEGLSDDIDDYHAIEKISQLGSVLWAEHRDLESEIVLSYALYLAEEYGNLGSSPGVEMLRGSLVRCCQQSLSLLYERLGRYAESEQLQQAAKKPMALSGIPELDQVNRALQSVSERYAHADLRRHADLCFKQGKLDEAEKLFLDALACLDQEQDKVPPITDEGDRDEIARQLKVSLGDTGYAETEAEEKESGKLNLESTLYLGTVYRLNILVGLADVYLAKNELSRADSVLAEAALLAEFVGKKCIEHRIEILNRQAEILCRQDKYAQAEPMIKLCIDLMQDLDPGEQSRIKLSGELEAKGIADCLSTARQQYKTCQERLSQSG